LVLNSLDARYGSTYRIRALWRVLKSSGYRVQYIEGSGPKLSRFRTSFDVAFGRYHVLFTQKFNPVTLLAMLIARLRGKPIVVDWDDLDAGLQSNRLKGLLAAVWERIGPSLASTVTTHSQAIRQRAVRDGLPVYLLPQGFDEALFRPDLVCRARARGDLGLAEHDFLVGYMCTFTHGGAIDISTVLDVFSEVNAPDVRFLIIGGGPLHGRIEDLVKRLGIQERVQFTGLVPHERVPAILSALDLAVVYMSDTPANRARVSFKVLECLAMEVPVVGHLVGESERAFGHLIHKADRKQLPGAIRAAREAPLPRVDRQSVHQYRWNQLAGALDQAVWSALSRGGRQHGKESGS